MFKTSPSPAPNRQVGFPSLAPNEQIAVEHSAPSLNSENVHSCLTDVRPLAASHRQIVLNALLQTISNGLAQQTLSSGKQDGSTGPTVAPAPVSLEDPPLLRGRRRSRPSPTRSTSNSSFEFGSKSRSRSRAASSLREQLFERDPSKARQSSKSNVPSPMSSFCHRSTGSTGSDFLDPPSSGEPLWSPAQEFLSNLGKRGENTATSLIDSVTSLSEASEFLTAGVEVDGWEVGRFLGAGSFGHVRTCKRLQGPSKSTPDYIKPGTLAAVKVVPLAQDSQLASEVEIWSKLPPHNNVLPLHGVYSTENTSYVFMPLCEGGNLLEYLQDFGDTGFTGFGPVRTGRSRGRRTFSNRNASSSAEDGSQARRDSGALPFPLAKHIFGQVASGVAHLHANKVTHCDIKLENILLDNATGRFRLADFGMAQAHAAEVSSEAIMAELDGRPQSFTEGFHIPSSVEQIMSHNPTTGREPSPTPVVDAPAGSLEYAAPERLKIVASGDLRPGVDIWALGCVLYTLLSGSLPFADEFEPRLRMKVLKGSWDIPRQLVDLQNNTQCDALLELLRGCLHVEETGRWTITRVLESEWISTAWDGDHVMTDEQLFRINPRRNKSRSQSRGRRALAIDTTSANPTACNTPYEHSPYRRRPRSRSRESSNSAGRRSNYGSAPGSSTRVPNTLSE